QAEVETETISARPLNRSHVLGVRMKVGLLLITERERRAPGFAKIGGTGFCHEPDTGRNLRRSAISHPLQLGLHGLPDTRLVIDRDERSVQKISAVSVIVDAHVVSRDIPLGNDDWHSRRRRSI